MTLLAFELLSGSAAAGVLPLPQPVAVNSPVVASPIASSLAYVGLDDQVQAASLASPGRAYTMPVPEFPAAVAPGTAILLGGLTGIDQLDLASGAVTPVRPRRPRGLTGTLYVDRAGARWLEGYVGAADRNVPVIVNRTTGRVIDTDGTVTSTARSWGARRWIDLSRRTQPAVHLCAPIQRVDLASSGRPRYGALLKAASWTLRETTRPAPTVADPLPRSRWVLQRCATRAAITLRTTTTPILGSRYLAWIDTDAVHLRTLATGRTRRYALPDDSGQAPTIAMSTDELVISSGGDTPHSGYNAYRIPLR